MSHYEFDCEISKYEKKIFQICIYYSYRINYFKTDWVEFEKNVCLMSLNNKITLLNCIDMI